MLHIDPLPPIFALCRFDDRWLRVAPILPAEGHLFDLLEPEDVAPRRLWRAADLHLASRPRLRDRVHRRAWRKTHRLALEFRLATPRSDHVG
jgi:hypothetical protein